MTVYFLENLRLNLVNHSIFSEAYQDRKHARNIVSCSHCTLQVVRLGLGLPNLTTRCSDGHGSVRGIHCVRAAAESEGVYAAPHGATRLRRLLGLLLFIHFQRQRHGQGQ